MSSSSTDTTCGGNSDLLRRVRPTNNENKLLLRPKITFALGRSISSNSPQVLRNDDLNSVHFMQIPATELNKPKLNSSQTPFFNGNVSKLHQNNISISPLIGFIGPPTTNPSTMITPNMTIKDRERRAALLADSPELPSKPPLDWYVQLFSLLEFPTDNIR